MPETVDHDLVARYANGTLSKAEADYVDQLATKSPQWADALRQAMGNNAEPMATTAAEEPVPVKPPKKRTLPRWMMRAMVVGYILLAVALVFVLLDVFQNRLNKTSPKKKEPATQPVQP
jgi:ferric-dicitrate binding protein FerR (iron transport regulator)